MRNIDGHCQNTIDETADDKHHVRYSGCVQMIQQYNNTLSCEVLMMFVVNRLSTAASLELIPIESSILTTSSEAAEDTTYYTEPYGTVERLSITFSVCDC